jgi:predicted metal-dependent hydrolase
MKSRRSIKLITIGTRQAKLQGRTIEYTLKQSPRIGGVRLEVRTDSGLTVVVPKRYSLHYVDELLDKKSDWILRHLSTPPLQMPLFHKEVDHGEKVPYMGKRLELVVTSDGARSAGAYLKGNKLHISTAPGFSRAKVLEAWYRDEAARVFTEKADRFQQQMGLHYGHITIRGQKKRWASASPTGALSINWKLLLAPEEIIDYVIMHELAHFKHMDHSRNFWEFLARFCPKWREYRRWLVTHEDELKTSASFGR